MSGSLRILDIGGDIAVIAVAVALVLAAVRKHRRKRRPPLPQRTALTESDLAQRREWAQWRPEIEARVDGLAAKWDGMTRALAIVYEAGGRKAPGELDELMTTQPQLRIINGA